uniref:ANK_REP_REGION domain-containing protein n=1 Tax=Steinernema glaseri TaxID=37863 RepID=A0A1I8A8N2_9BILA
MWREAAASAFSVASAIPDMDSAGNIADVFENVEAGESATALALGPAFISSARNANGESLLMVCARCGHTDIVRLILADSEIEDTDNEGWSALLNSAHKGHVDIVRLLLEAGCAVDQTDLMGWTPLMWAVYKNHGAIVDLLLDYSAHVNMIDEEDGLTPLIVAAGRGFTDIVQRLINADAQVNACDKFGSTALIWASRKGHLPVIELLLNNGAELDAVGMYSSTALMLATRGNYISVVEAILAREPNVNVVDNNGLSALGMAAREGYAEIAEALIHSGSFVNLVDRFGNSILASAVRSGNANIVRMLLDKYADVNARDSDNRTALHLAIDKSYMDMVLVLLEKKPNLELKNKDGETPLLRAVKSRHVALCQLLVNAGSKISATDNAGDNALHLALRARSRRLTQILLANPSDSRLLYRPNKLGQTPYSIDQSNPQPIIPLIFGPVDSELNMDTMLGYDIYSNVLADIVCEPNLTLPLTVGLYAKWGSGKSLLLSKMKDAMKSFSRSWLDGVELRWSWSLIFFLLLVCSLFTLIAVTALSVTANLELLFAVIVVGSMVFLALVGIYGIIYYGSEVKMWSSSIRAARHMARVLARIKLVLSVITVHAPLRKEKDLATCPVSFLFADYHRLSSIGGEQALGKIVTTLFEAAENHYGTFAVRIFTALRSSSGQSSDSKLRRMCGFPVVLVSILSMISLSVSLIMLTHYFINRENMLVEPTNYLIAAAIFLVIFVLTIIYPLYILLVYVTTNVPKKRINAAALNVDKLRFEGFMQKLQQEVDLLTDTIHSLDAFTRSQTRLLVVVDGLDNCEQQKMVQALDALDLLFSSRPNRPFIVTLAIDPHIIISAINHNMKSALSGTELTGYDYLQNIVNMPFYLHNSALRQLQNNLREKRESLAEWKERFRRQDTFHGSHLSLRDHNAGDARYRKSTGIGVLGTRNLGYTLLNDDYFSSMNPRAMKRIVNALTLTGRLMRSFEIEFSWLTLGHWVSLIEQWPFRMSWLIDRASDLSNDSFSLAQVYYQLKEEIPKKDALTELDRNSDNFEMFLERACTSGVEMLTIGHVKRFVPCTSNLDPYLRKLIRERRGELDPPKLHPVQTAPGSLTQGSIVMGPARYLFGDEAAWSCIEVPLVEMKIDDIVQLVAKLDIPLDRMNGLLASIRSLNLNGLVLQTCDLEELHRSLRLSLGDWTLFRLLVETLRPFVPFTSGSHRKQTGATVILQQANSMSSLHESRRKLTSQNELESDHQWLMESLQSMDAIQVEDGLVDADGSMKSSKIRFEEATDDDRASEADSTESMFGSQENLLESPSIDVRRQTGTREDMMKRMRLDSTQVPEELSNSLLRRSLVRRQSTVVSDADENQVTVQRRRGGDTDKPDLRKIFNNGNV